METRDTHAPINWTTAIFLFGSLAVALIGTPLYVWRYGLSWFDVGHFVVMVYLTGLSITVGYHRLYAHRSFDASWPVRLGTLLFGAATFEASVLGWASEHRYHHRYTDKDGNPYDPHSIERGFFHAHMGWLLRYRVPELPKSNVDDIAKDPLVRFQDRYYIPLAVGVGLGLPTAVGAAWAAWHGTSVAVGALGGFLIAGWARIVFVQHATFFINSLSHTIGRRPYDSTQSSRDSAIVAVLTFGEGYHNFHHAFQADYRNGVNFWQWDPGKWVIWALSKVGLTWNLRRTRDETILMARLRERRRLREERVKAGKIDLSTQATALLHDLDERLEETYRQFRQIYSEYSKLARDRLAERRERLAELREELIQLRRTLRDLAREYRVTERMVLAGA